MTSGSRVVTPGTALPASTAKLFGLDGIAGLIGGLVIGVAYVAVQAVVSDRLRRRDEVASLLGAPVELSLKPVRHPRMRPQRWVRRSALKRQGEVAMFRRLPASDAEYAKGDQRTLLVVALDDLTVPAAALAVLAKRLADKGEAVLVADLTSEGLLARVMGDLRIEGSIVGRPVGRHIAGVYTIPRRDE